VSTNRKATAEKRARERARQERQKLKTEKRAQRRAEKLEKPDHNGGEDPDLAGIVWGPQAPQE
jgi:hypothetical protein